MTSDQNTGQSEVARLMAAISSEYEAARSGLTGLSQGQARHCFINARMERMGELHSKMMHFVGPDEAIRLYCQAVETRPEHK